MNANITRQTFMINETILSASAEQPIESDILLPDYCPDILKILKCAVNPVVASSQITGDKLTVDAIANLSIYYLSENRKIRCTEQKIPFGKIFDLKATGQNPVVDVQLSVDYINCRAVNQRRIDVRGAVTISVRVTASREESTVSDTQEPGVHIKRDMLRTGNVVGCTDKQFTVREDLELESGKSPIGAILRSRGAAAIDDYRAITNKIILKGSLELTVLYQCEQPDDALETMRLTLPISQIIDMDGVDEDTLCCILPEIISCELTPKADLDGENRMISAQVTIRTNVRAYKNTDLVAVSDAYSTKYPCKNTAKMMPVLQLREIVNDSFQYKNTVGPLDDGITQIIDLWCQPISVSAQMDGSELTVNGKIMVCMFALDSEGELCYLEKMMDTEVKREAQPCDEMIFEPKMQIISTAHTFLGQNVEVRCDLRMIGSLCNSVKCNMISDIELDENKPITRDNNSALTLYFAEKGETLWEIAKRYGTSVDAVLQENALGSEVIPEKQMLIVPIIG